MSRSVTTIRVAIVDDSAVVVRSLEGILAEANDIAVVGTFPSVEHLLASVMLEKLHVVLLDVWMPQRSGLAALRDITAAAKVIVISDTGADSPIAKEALKQGASAFFSKPELSKPAGKHALLKAIRAAMGSETTRRDATAPLTVDRSPSDRARREAHPSPPPRGPGTGTFTAERPERRDATGQVAIRSPAGSRDHDKPLSATKEMRVVIVDDSDVVVRSLERIIGDSPDIAVLATFPSVDHLLQSDVVKQVHVVLLDVWMPQRSGLSALREIAAHARVIVISDTDSGSPVAKEALAQGAAAFMTKREIGASNGKALLRAIRANAGTTEVAREGIPLLTIVGSTGAPRALERIMPALKDLEAAIAIVQHGPIGSEHELARWITSLGVPAQAARNGDPIEAGHALVAPGGAHMVLGRTNAMRLEAMRPEDIVAPSGDRFLESAVHLERRLVAVVLSGMGNDGARGVGLVIEAGATVIVQHPDDCVVDSMPRAAMAMSPNVRPERLDRIVSHVRLVLLNQRPR